MTTQKFEAQKLNTGVIPCNSIFITWNLRVFRIVTAADIERAPLVHRYIIHHLGKPVMIKDVSDARWQYEIYKANYKLKPNETGYIGCQRWAAEEVFDYFKRPKNDFE